MGKVVGIMRGNDDIAKLVEIVIDLEQAKEFVSKDNQIRVLKEAIPFLYLVCNQLMYSLPECNLTDRVDGRIAELQGKLEELDNEDIKGYLCSVFDYIIWVIRDYLKESNTS